MSNNKLVRHAIGILVCILVGALSTVIPTFAAAKVPVGSYRGQVLDSHGKDGVGSAVVVFTNKETSEAVTVTSDANGRYETPLASGTYSVVIILGGKTYQPVNSAPVTTGQKWSLKFFPADKQAISFQELELTSEKRNVSVEELPRLKRWQLWSFVIGAVIVGLAAE